jgi:menaquinone-dependent protoporphyrinogen oxidase
VARVLVVYATIEGQTARIAERIAQRLRGLGHSVASHRADKSGSGLDLAKHFAACNAVIVGASVHYGKHASHLRRLLRGHRAELAARRSAFFSVSVSAGGPGAKPEAAQRYLQSFLRQVGWQPPQSATFAGALPYSKYGAFKRMLVTVFVRVAGGDTDTSRDYEYTDWNAVDRFAAEFAQQLGPWPTARSQPSAR